MKNHRCGKGSCECACLACEKDDDGDDAALLESVAKCARMLQKNNGDSNGAEEDKAVRGDGDDGDDDHDDDDGKDQGNDDKDKAVQEIR